MAARIPPHSRPPPIVERLEKGETIPTCVLIVGMAGSGKTTLLHRLQQPTTRTTSGNSVNDKETKNYHPIIPTADDLYCVNLDPAVLDVSYEVDIDIRDTVNYKSVMKFHKLGPNGAIMTSLNLFSTKFDQVITLLEKRAFPESSSSSSTANKEGEENSAEETIQEEEEESKKEETKTGTTDKEEGEKIVVSNGDDGAKKDDDQDSDDDDKPMKYILVDTPGQIEAFTWSASGSIISESLASSFPTVLVFVVDTARCAASPNTFMSNMLYACSMLYRTKLPLVVCFNKTDVVSHQFCLEWMRDYEAFQEALDNMDNAGFYGSLTRSLSMVLDEFYSNFANAVGVSAVTGDGIDEFWTTVHKAATQDFVTDYIQDLKDRMEEQEARTMAMARHNVVRLQRDLEKETK
jgi:GPN-loop GTPase